LRWPETGLLKHEPAQVKVLDVDVDR